MISIHALLAESDYTPRLSRVVPTPNFYPRSPCGERQRVPLAESTSESISIHALLAESDNSCNSQYIDTDYFYPRSPCGERLAPCQLWHGVFLFLSTLSLRRATSRSQIVPIALADFYPRSPCGERPCATTQAP